MVENLLMPSFYSPIPQDMIQHDKVIPQEVVLLIVDNLLEVVEKLHKAEIIHGNLNPETLFLGDRLATFVY